MSWRRSYETARRADQAAGETDGARGLLAGAAHPAAGGLGVLIRRRGLMAPGHHRRPAPAHPHHHAAGGPLPGLPARGPRAPLRRHRHRRLRRVPRGPRGRALAAAPGRHPGHVDAQPHGWLRGRHARLRAVRGASSARRSSTASPSWTSARCSSSSSSLPLSSPCGPAASVRRSRETVAAFLRNPVILAILAGIGGSLVGLGEALDGHPIGTSLLTTIGLLAGADDAAHRHRPGLLHIAARRLAARPRPHAGRPPAHLGRPGHRLRRRRRARAAGARPAVRRGGHDDGHPAAALRRAALHGAGHRAATSSTTPSTTTPSTRSPWPRWSRWRPSSSWASSTRAEPCAIAGAGR